MQIWSLILAKVDPFVIQWPTKWMQDDEIRPVIEYLNRYLHDMFIRSGGGEDLIDDNQEQVITALGAQLKDLQNQVGSGELLTVDTTSWTVDATNFWADETEA